MPKLQQILNLEMQQKSTSKNITLE